MSKRGYTHVKEFEPVILQMREAGKTRREIAEQLGLTKRQIETWIKRRTGWLDLSFVREETYHLYNHKTGRPPIEPEVLVKYLLVGFLYGIPSERQIEERIRDSVPLRWYLGLDLFDPVPDHSTISQNRRRRPAFRKVSRRLFEEVVRQCVASGLASGRLVATDSSHMKANASRASEELMEVTEEAGAYWERLDRYEEEGLKDLERRTGKQHGKRTKQVRSRPWNHYLNAWVSPTTGRAMFTSPTLFCQTPLTIM